jgi:hypothetical protein
MDQPFRSSQKDLPPDHPEPRPRTPPDPADPDLDIDVIDIKLPGGDAPSPDLDPPRERVESADKPVATAPDTKSRDYKA